MQLEGPSDKPSGSKWVEYGFHIFCLAIKSSADLYEPETTLQDLEWGEFTANEGKSWL